MKHVFFSTFVPMISVVTSPLCLAWSPPPIDNLSLGAHVGAVVAAGFEIAEDVSEVGHGHGVVLLCASKLCLEINILRETGIEQVEDMIDENAKPRFASLVLGALSSKAVVVTLATGALAAASLEVIKNSIPGGQHGTVFLATNDLIDQLEESQIVNGQFLGLLQNHPFRISVSVGAAAAALAETVSHLEDWKIGAHHGVLVLALSRLAFSIGRMREEIESKKD